MKNQNPIVLFRDSQRESSKILMFLMYFNFMRISFLFIFFFCIKYITCAIYDISKYINFKIIENIYYAFALLPNIKNVTTFYSIHYATLLADSDVLKRVHKGQRLSTSQSLKFISERRCNEFFKRV